MLIQGCQTESSPSCLQAAHSIKFATPYWYSKVVGSFAYLKCATMLIEVEREIPAHLSTVRKRSINARSSKTPVAAEHIYVITYCNV